MSYLLGFLLLFVAIGIVLKMNALMLENKRPRVYYHYAPRKKEAISKPVMKLLLFIAIVIVYVIGFTLEKTYYNHYFLALLFMSLGLMLVLSVSVGIFFTSYGRQLFSTQIRYYKIFIIVTGFLGLALGLFACFNMGDYVNGLVEGPRFSTGIVEQKTTGNGGRLGPLFYVTIDDEKYQVLDYQWWQSINKGDQLNFAYNVQAEFDNSIFQPEKISFSTSGILVSSVGVVFWLVTIGISLNGYMTLFRKQYDSELPMYNDFYAKQGDPLIIKSGTRAKRSSIVWVILGGLLTVMIVAWRSFRRSTKSS